MNLLLIRIFSIGQSMSLPVDEHQEMEARRMRK
jgi:hypothetical protein